jgi:arylsulfatase A-like enzyme
MQIRLNALRTLAAASSLVIWVVSSGVAMAADWRSGKPNIVFIVADGVGYDEVALAGSKQSPTPNIDALAKAGARFTEGYSSSPVTGPSLAAILTGQYPQRFGFEANAEGDAARSDHGPRALDAKQVTLAQRLKVAGYAPGLVGAWDLGSAQGTVPTERGFDEFFGVLSDQAGADGLALYRGAAQVDKSQTKPQERIAQFGSEAVSFIDRHGKDPFFLYLPITSSIGSNATTQPLADGKIGRSAYLTQLDDVVGRVTAKLHDEGLEENTLIAFVSDDGGDGNTNRLKGTNWTLWEGGIRVPFVISWKGKISPGQVFEQPVIGLDLAPTALTAASVTTEPDWHLDGANLLPLLEGQSTAAPHEALYWRFGPQFAIRQGNWKLVKAHDGAKPQFFYLQDDAVEANDLLIQQSARVKAAQASWDTWNAGNEAPRWDDKRWNGDGPGGKSSTLAAADGAGSRLSGPWASGDSLTRKQAPDIAGKALDILVEIEPTGDKGVAVAQGGAAQGYAIYLTEGKLAFAVRESGELVTIVAKEPLGKGHFHVEATLASGGALSLSVDGKQVAQGKAAGPIPRQPAGAFNVGNNGKAAVGDYETPNPFAGKVSNVRVQTSG